MVRSGAGVDWCGVSCERRWCVTTDWIVMVISSNFSSRVLSSVSRPWERLHTGGNNQGHSSKANIINVFQYFDFMIT